jgi:hypothetical protein
MLYLVVVLLSSSFAMTSSRGDFGGAWLGDRDRSSKKWDKKWIPVDGTDWGRTTGFDPESEFRIFVFCEHESWSWGRTCKSSSLAEQTLHRILVCWDWMWSWKWRKRKIESNIQLSSKMSLDYCFFQNI